MDIRRFKRFRHVAAVGLALLLDSERPMAQYGAFGTEEATSSVSCYSLTELHSTTGHGQFGYSVARAGDVNGDGFGDLIVGEPYVFCLECPADAFVFSGKDWALLHTFSHPPIIGQFGYSVSGAGDVNADGFADLIVGSPSYSIWGGGGAYVYSGLDGTLLYSLSPYYWNDEFGTAVAGVGDIDGDGHDDMAVGAPAGYFTSDYEDSTGHVYLYSGATGALIRTLTGLGTEDAFGARIAAVGDLNGDNVSDLVIGAPYACRSGWLNCVGGGGGSCEGVAYGYDGEVNVYSGLDGALLYTLWGDDCAFFGYSIADAGDVDRDGVVDLVIGAPLYGGLSGDNDDDWRVGRAYVYSGTSGTLLHMFTGQIKSGEMGTSVSGAGDVNKDGFADVIISVPCDGSYPCASSVNLYSGADGSLLQTFVGDGWNGFGTSVLGAGDLNKDGVPDLAVGSPGLMSMFSCGEAALEFVDPHDEIFDLADLATRADDWVLSTSTVDGVAADGTTRLVLRVPAGDAERATFSIETAGELGTGIGALQGLNLQTEAQSILITEKHSGYFLCVYKAPDEYLRAGMESQDAGATNRKVRIAVDRVKADGSSLPLVTQDFPVYRPPVVLLHGLWSSGPDCFKYDYRSTLEDGTKRVVTVKNYEATNHLEFSRNITVPQEGIQEALAEMRARGIAATQCDVVAHSMGGLLTRLYIQNDQLYKRPDNFEAGDVYRLITIDSPHFGSPIADYLIRMADVCQAFPGSCGDHINPCPTCSKINACQLLKYIECMISKKENGIDGGAVADLRSEGQAITRLEQTPVPCHALVSDASATGLPIGSTMENWLWRLFDYFIYSIITGQQFPSSAASALCQHHDYVVPIESQIGGLSTGEYTYWGSGIHTQATDYAFAPDVLTLLNTPISTPEVWGHFQAYSPLSICPPLPLPPPAPSASQTESMSQLQSGLFLSDSLSVVVLSPASGTLMHPGESHHVILQVSGLTQPFNLAVIGDGIVQDLPSSPYEFDWTVPLDAIDQVNFVVFATQSDTFAGAVGPFEFPVQVNDAVVYLEASPRYLPLKGLNASGQITVTGYYENGAIRNVTSSARGTTYQSADPSIATVTPEGAVTSVSKGTTKIMVSNNSINATCNVVVTMGPTPPPPDTIPPTIDLIGICPDTLCQDSVASLSVVVSDAGSGVAFQSVPNGSHVLDASTPGIHTFTVTARDSAGIEATSSCTYLVVTCQMEPTCSCPCKYDPQCDSTVSDVLDVVGVINIAFRGSTPLSDAGCPRERSDVDCSGFTDVIDVVKVVDVAFRGADPAGKYCDPCAP